MKCCLAQQDGYECKCDAVQRMFELHREDPNGDCSYCSLIAHDVNDTAYPCATIRILTGEEPW